MFFFLWLGVLCLGVVPMTAGQMGTQGETETPTERAARLEREVAELKDAIDMLTENLANCAEENESLAAKTAGPKDGDDTISGEKVALLDKIRAVLDTEENLGFLTGLNERELNRLLGLIQDRVKMTPTQTGKTP